MAKQNAWGYTRADDGVIFRLWAPKAGNVRLVVNDRQWPMDRKNDGFWQAHIAEPAQGTPYQFEIDGQLRPDPASRGQLADTHGPSIYLRPDSFEWSDDAWKGRPWEEAVFYELHVGAFTPEGTFRSAAAELPRLADLGITAVELMPLAQSQGKRNWGYDGVLHYAPHNAYGKADDLRFLVDTAHSLGLMIFIDVVYNHFGPEGNYLSEYAPTFFRYDLKTPWGAAIDYRQQPVRDFFRENALYWLDEFHFDGLRLDAIDQIRDDRPHILEEISQAVRLAFPTRYVHLVTENPASAPDLLAPYRAGKPLYRADWNDDFHHAVHVVATGEAGGHYSNFSEHGWHGVGIALSEGYIFKGERLFDGDEFDIDGIGPTSYVIFLQNHDQVGNRGMGDRLNTQIEHDQLRLWTALLLLAPQIPLLFMGEDIAAETPFFFFCDFTGDLGDAVRANRPQEADSFGGMPEGTTHADIPDPNDEATFRRSKIRPGPRAGEQQAMIRELLALRRKHVIPLLPLAERMDSTRHETPDGLICIDWRLGGRTLSLRCNFTDVTQQIHVPAGEVIYAYPASTVLIGASLPARTIIWALG